MVKLSVEEAVKVLNRYDNEHYTPKTREAHRMAIAALTDSSWTPVGVVQCKDCRMYEENREARTTFCRRELNYLYAKPDGFCSYGVRRLEE